MHSKKKKDMSVECRAQPLIKKTEPLSPATDAQNELGVVALAVAADQVKLQQGLAQQKDDYLRLAADFDNFKKRSRRDSEQQAAAQKEAFIGELLPALDNLERALASDKAADSTQLRQGVTLTLQQLARLLQQHGIEAVEDLGQPFDPHRHAAVSIRNDPSQPDQMILEVTQRGYCRGAHVFRPAQVIVNDLRQAPEASHAG